MDVIPRRSSASRDTEHGSSVSTFDKMAETKRQRGRPKGAKNKPKGLMPASVAYEFLGVVKDLVPQEYYEEMKRAIKDGKSISTVTEAKITLKLMGPAIWRRLIDEAKQKKRVIDKDLVDEIQVEDEPMEFAKDVTERLKVYQSLLQFIDKLERADDEGASSKTQQHIEILARRGIDSDRLRILVGIESGDMGRIVDGTGREVIEARAVSDTILERQVSLSDSEQGTSVGDVSDDSTGSDPRSVYEA